MKLQTEKGAITIGSDVFTNITGAAATPAASASGHGGRSKTDGLVHLLRRESMAKGVKVRFNEDDTVSIELHIIVDNGVNLTAVSPANHERGAYMVETHHRQGQERGHVRGFHSHRLTDQQPEPLTEDIDMRGTIDGRLSGADGHPRRGLHQFTEAADQQAQRLPCPDGIRA